MKRIFWIILIVVVAVLGVVWSVHRAKTRAQNSGDVYERNVAGDKSAVGADQAQQTAGAGNPSDADSLQRNPPNGVVFAGKGKFQLYRQGDITWRLNTDNGDACILFATDSQWRKLNVWQHGCGAA